MIKADIIRVFLAAASVITDETMARVLLDVARSPLNDSGEMYSLWCDNQGQCGDCGDNNWCSDEAQLACVLRFLQSEAQ